VKVYLYLKRGKGTEVWGTYGILRGWWYPSKDITKIPLSIFEAKQIQKRHKPLWQTDPLEY